MERGAGDSVLCNLRNTRVANNAYLRASQLAQSVACSYVPTHLRDVVTLYTHSKNNVSKNEA